MQAQCFVHDDRPAGTLPGPSRPGRLALVEIGVSEWPSGGPVNGAALGEIGVGHRIQPADPAVAAFVGLAPGGPVDEPVRVTSFAQFARTFSAEDAAATGPVQPGGSLAHAVRGFFANGGRACWVVRAAGVPGSAAADAHIGTDAAPRGVRVAAAIEGVSVLAVPDAHALAGGREDALVVQAAAVRACEAATDVIALLEPPPASPPAAVLAWTRAAEAFDTPSAAVYHPWLRAVSETSGEPRSVPPCGHVAGVWARVALTEGVHRTPTNEPLMGVEALADDLDAAAQRTLNRAGVNCLRRWPGSEARIWGGSTLSSDPDWRYLGRRRLVTNVAASLRAGTAWAADQPKDAALHDAVRQSVHGFLATLWREGVLPGATAGEAFWVRCGDDARGGARSDPDVLVIEAGVAVRGPRLFKVIRVVHGSPEPAAG